MKKKKVQELDLFAVKEEIKELKLIKVKEKVKETIFEPLKESLKDTYRLMTTNHYFLASEENENICRLCGKHGRNEIHGRSRK